MDEKKKEEQLEKNFLLFFWAVFLCMLFFGLVVFILYSFRTIAYPYITDYTEGHVLMLSRLLHEEGTYFFDVNNYPMINGVYTPVYIFATSLFLDSFFSPYVFGRMTSFLAAFFISVLLFSVFYRKSKNKILSFALSGLFFFPFYVIRWSTMNRPDVLAIALSFAGILAYYFWYKKKSPIRFLSIILFLLAYFTKQSAIIAPASVLFYALICDRKEFAKFSALYFLPLAAGISLLEVATGGLFIEHVIRLMRFLSPIRWEYFTFVYQEFLRPNSILVILIVVNIFLFRRHRLFTIYFLLNLLFVIARTKPGGNYNLLLEAHLSILLLGGMIFIDVYATKEKARTLMVSFLLLYAFLQFPYELSKELYYFPLVPERIAQDKTVSYYVENASGPILSEDMGILVTHGKDFYYEPFTFTTLYKYGYQPDNKIVQDCKNEIFSVIIAGQNIFDRPELSECLREHYIQKAAFPLYSVFIRGAK